jgi:hypothetical protein
MAAASSLSLKGLLAGTVPAPAWSWRATTCAARGVDVDADDGRRCEGGGVGVPARARRGAWLVGRQAAPQRWSLDMSGARGCCCCGERPPQPGMRLDARLLASRRRSSAKTAERVRPAGEEEEECGEAVGDAGARVSIAMARRMGTGTGTRRCGGHCRWVMGGRR